MGPETDNADSSTALITEYRKGMTKKIVLLIGCIIGIILAVGFLSLQVNDTLSLKQAYQILWDHLSGKTYPVRSKMWWADNDIWNTALVHALAAILAGAGLACCGCLMQSLMANPLADPYSTGISSGACLGAMMAIVMGISFGTLTGTGSTVFNAFVGAMIPALFIIVIAEKIHMTPATLILVGTAISMFFGAFISLIMAVTDSDTLQSVYLWQVGNFSKVNWNSIYIMLPITVVGSCIVIFLSNKLNIMSLGDNSAQSLGIDVKKFRMLSLTLMAIMTAGIVAYVGIIGFVGLVCPHIVRLLTGSDNKFVIPVSMALGAFIMLVADYLSMVGGLPVGVIVSAMGALIFFIIIVLSKSSGKGAIY